MMSKVCSACVAYIEPAHMVTENHDDEDEDGIYIRT